MSSQTSGFLSSLCTQTQMQRSQDKLSAYFSPNAQQSLCAAQSKIIEHKSQHLGRQIEGIRKPLQRTGQP